MRVSLAMLGGRRRRWRSRLAASSEHGEHAALLLARARRLLRRCFVVRRRLLHLLDMLDDRLDQLVSHNVAIVQVAIVLVVLRLADHLVVVQKVHSPVRVPGPWAPVKLKLHGEALLKQALNEEADSLQRAWRNQATTL